MKICSFVLLVQGFPQGDERALLEGGCGLLGDSQTFGGSFLGIVLAIEQPEQLLLAQGETGEQLVELGCIQLLVRCGLSIGKLFPEP